MSGRTNKFLGGQRISHDTLVDWLIAMSWNWFRNSFSLLTLMADELWFWQNECFSRFRQPDKRASSSNPENNVCFLSLAIIVTLKSVYENAQLSRNCAYVKNESLASSGLQSVTSLVNYLRGTAVHATELTWFVALLWCVPLLSPARWDLGLTNTTTAQNMWPKPVVWTSAIVCSHVDVSQSLKQVNTGHSVQQNKAVHSKRQLSRVM